MTRSLYARMPKTIRLQEVCDGNPFAGHPQLRTIWPGAYAERAESDTVRCLAKPEGRKVFLILGDGNKVVGITGYYFFDDDKALGLRWHGVVPCMQRHIYSKIAMELLCAQGKLDHPERETLIEVMPADATAHLDKPFRRHGFERFGEPAEYDWLMPGLWQAYQRSLPSAASAQSTVRDGYEKWRYSSSIKHDMLRTPDSMIAAIVANDALKEVVKAIQRAKDLSERAGYGSIVMASLEGAHNEAHYALDTVLGRNSEEKAR